MPKSSLNLNRIRIEGKIRVIRKEIERTNRISGLWHRGLDSGVGKVTGEQGGAAAATVGSGRLEKVIGGKEPANRGMWKWNWRRGGGGPGSAQLQTLFRHQLRTGPNPTWTPAQRFLLAKHSTLLFLLRFHLVVLFPFFSSAASLPR